MTDPREISEAESRPTRPPPIALFCIVGMAAYPVVVMEARHYPVASHIPFLIGLFTLKLAGYIGMFRMRKWGTYAYCLGFLLDIAYCATMGNFPPRLLVSAVVAANGLVYLSMMTGWKIGRTKPGGAPA
jgi:hypothetical protein